MKLLHEMLFLFLSIICISCEHHTVRQKIEAFISQPVAIDLDSMVSARMLNAQFPQRNISAEYIWVDYVDSLECTDCAIKKFAKWRELMNSECARRLDFLFILSPNRHHLKSVLVKLQTDTLLNNYIYVDTCNVFIRQNSHIPKERYLHTFLLDRQGKVILVGNPNANIRVDSLFHGIMNKQKGK